MSYRTLIFDLDGTLLDTLDDLHASVNHALDTHGFPLRSREEVRAALGNGVRRLIMECLPSESSVAEQESTLATFRQHYLVHSLDRTAPYAGILPLLAELQARGISMALVSNKLDAAVQELHQRFFAQYISLAIGEGVYTPPKPDPTGVMRAMEQLGATPSTALYVGDSEVDHATARAAGIASGLVLWGFRDEERLRALHADHYVSAPHELLSLVN